MLAFVPHDWEETTLSELCTIRREIVEPSSTGGQRYVGLEHIDPGVFRLRRWGDERDLRSTKSRFYAGDVLYGKLRPYLDKAVLAEWEGVCSTDILTLTPNTEVADASYLSFLLHTSSFIAHAIATTSGVNHPRTSWTSLANYSHPVPALVEQRAIAAVLSKIQAAVEAQDKIIATLKELKAATMAKLFREGLRGEPLKQTEIGEIPEHWKVIHLGKIAQIGNGSTPKRDNPSYWEHGHIPWLTSAKVHESVIESADEFVTKVARQECHLPLVKKGSVVVAITGQGKTLGNAALITFDTCVSQHLAYIQLQTDEVLPEFVLFFLQGRYGHFRQVSRAGGSTKGALTCGFLKNYSMPVPPLEEQKQIAKTIASLAKKLKAAESRRQTLNYLFSSMLHLLMTGQVRLNDLQLDEVTYG